MGFFGGKKTYVASSIYNLAGDTTERPSYLKTTVAGTVIGNSQASIPTTLRDAYLHGPGIKLRSFYRWAQDHYSEIGIPTGDLGSVINVDAVTVEGQLPGLSGKTARVQRVDAGGYDYAYFAEQWMFDNHPDLIDTEWFADVDEVTEEITIVFEDLTTDTFFPAADRTARYIYVLYNQVDNATGDWGDALLFIYQVGSGNAVLDALVTSTDDDGEYIPHIPIRLDNHFLSDSYNPAAYTAAKKAYKKAIGGNLDDLIDKIADNESLPDIDYAYVVFGVPLNVIENASKEYLYRFFDKCRLSQIASGGEFTGAASAWQAYEDSVAAWQEWKVAQGHPEDPLYGTREPTLLSQPASPGSEVRIKSSGSTNTNLDMKISWGSIVRTIGSGLKKPGAKKGDIWLEVSPDTTGVIPILGGIISGGKIVQTTSGDPVKPIVISWQVEEDSWQSLAIYNMVHTNLIYNNKSVVIGASEALEDPDESGFIVPLHYATVREMSLVQSTQMMTAASYVVFNSYKVVKTKWYQTGFFKLIVIIVIIVITVVTAGTGTAPAIGLLGTAASVGAALGLTGLAALIVGTIVNTLAAMILTQLIMMGSTAVFGAKWGQIIGAVISVISLNVGSAMSSGVSMAQMFNSMTSATSLIGMTSAVGNGISGALAASAASWGQKTQDLIEQTQRDMKSLNEKFAAEFGYDRAMLNPMGLTDTPFGNFVESEETFLTRTLLTGSDIAEMSHDMINNFTSYTLRLDLKPF